MAGSASQSRDLFERQIADFNRRAGLHNGVLLRFLAASPFGEPLLNRELARQGVNRSDFERRLTIDIKAETIPS